MYATEMVSGGMIGTGVKATLRLYLRYLRGFNVGITDGVFMIYTTEMASCGIIYILSFIKVGKGVQATLRFGLGDLNGCNVGITDRRNLCSVPLKWAQVV
jgi:hypothetical protein